MQILLVLFVAGACLPLPWPASPFELSPTSSALATFGLTLIPIALAIRVARRTVRDLLRDPQNRVEIVTRYAKTRRLLGFANLAVAAIAVLVLGWGHTVWETVTVPIPRKSRPVLVPAAELLVPAPYFLGLFSAWVIYYRVDRTLHQTASPGSPEFWSLGGYVLFHVRQFALMVLLPISLFVSQHSLVRVVPSIAETWWFKIGSVFAVGLLFVILPRLVKPLLGLQPLPAGPKRSRLEETARRLQFRYAGLLLWPTRGAMANALVIGVVPWARYVIFTDRLLEAMDEAELDAVLGHEIGHAAHGHIPYYAAFLLASAAAGAAATAALADSFPEMDFPPIENWDGWLAIPPLLLMAGYLFAVFGMLSRRCERQADVYGCRAGSCGDPGCRGHDADTYLVPAGGPVCPTGVRALIRALDHVAILNGMETPPSGSKAPRSFRKRLWAWIKAWQHGPISDRIEFLLQLTEDGSLADRSDRRAFRFRVGLLAILILTVVVLGSLVGWEELLRML